MSWCLYRMLIFAAVRQVPILYCSPSGLSRCEKPKLEALESAAPDIIATANVGCQTHLSHGANTRVMHWIELVS
jgi:hypothetical protein